VLIGFFVLNGPKVKTYTTSPGRFAEVSKPDLTLENLYDELVWQGVKYPEIVFRQAALETMWLKCQYCSKQFNNLFGFKTTEYLKFNHWTESVAYYKQWQDKLYKGGDYYQFLHNVGYATAPNYIQTLKVIDKELIRAVKENSATYWEF
jgi:flagellum-specific peptidoglycan hydrolase FlgJ